VWLAVNESDALLKMARFQYAADVAIRGLGPVRQVGLGASWGVTVLAADAAEALLARWRVAEAAARIDPLTTGPPDRDHWVLHEARAELDLLRGDVDAAAARRLIDAIPAHRNTVDTARDSAQLAAELALWDGRPHDALAAVRRVLPLDETPDLAILCRRLLAPERRRWSSLV